MTLIDGVLVFDVDANLEGFVAGVDLSTVTDTNASAAATDYDALHGMDPAAFEATFRDFWPIMAAKITVTADGIAVPPDLISVKIPDVGPPDLARTSRLTFHVNVPDDVQIVTFAWDPAFGSIVLRQQGVDAPYDGYLTGGQASDPINIGGGGQVGLFQTFVDYIPIGFVHILPKGFDHILFVLGLFFLSPKISPLLWQISAFTVAHTIALALGALGYVNVPVSIVEPLIAGSIVFVAVENILTGTLHRWRPLIVFGFGLLHGLGFASVLGGIGLPDGAFIPALIGFNIGVEVGQLTVIAIAFAVVGFWFNQKSWYRSAISVPASVAIALMGTWWVIERTML